MHRKWPRGKDRTNPTRVSFPSSTKQETAKKSPNFIISSCVFVFAFDHRLICICSSSRKFSQKDFRIDAHD
ncbi:unnamed protein product [Lactuca virosa]|uniref:Uncharacterized protein n=1 Tax=Lactuca virosa TaxID=75947 RepID=A0AAU9MHU9_9ASTR|nr:unnamed protein product [Lactuca virosa]